MSTLLRGVSDPDGVILLAANTPEPLTLLAIMHHMAEHDGEPPSSEEMAQIRVLYEARGYREIDVTAEEGHQRSTYQKDPMQSRRAVSV